jgi:hypothetical protein
VRANAGKSTRATQRCPALRGGRGIRRSQTFVLSLAISGDPRLFASTLCGAWCGYRRADLKKAKNKTKLHAPQKKKKQNNCGMFRFALL